MNLKSSLKETWKKVRPAHLHAIDHPHIIFFLKINKKFVRVADYKLTLELTLESHVANHLERLITTSIERHLRLTIPRPSTWVQSLESFKNIDQGNLSGYKVQNVQYTMPPTWPSCPGKSSLDIIFSKNGFLTFVSAAGPSTRRSGIHPSQPSRSEVPRRYFQARAEFEKSVAVSHLGEVDIDTPTPSQPCNDPSASTPSLPASILKRSDPHQIRPGSDNGQGRLGTLELPLSTGSRIQPHQSSHQ